jgi:tetratricopeptide (TPR) repeat protein
MTPRALPRNPNPKLIDAEARRLLRDFRQGTAPALTRYSIFDSLPNTSNPRLADAQLIIAREYGYASWLKLKQRVDVLSRESAILEELVGLSVYRQQYCNTLNWVIRIKHLAHFLRRGTQPKMHCHLIDLVAYLLGEFYRSQGQFEKALASFNEAMEITTHAGDLEHLAYSHSNIAVLDTVIGNWDFTSLPQTLRNRPASQKQTSGDC